MPAMSMNIYKPLGITAIVIVTAVVMYFLTVGYAVDLIDGFVEADLVAGQIPDVTIANYVLAVYSLVLAGAVLIPAALLLKNKNRLYLAVLAIAGGLVAMFGIAAGGLVGFPQFQMTPEKWVIIPALYLVFVLRDPGVYMLVETSCIGIVFLVLSSATGIDE
jgi:hypothetical protein